MINKLLNKIGYYKTEKDMLKRVPSKALYDEVLERLGDAGEFVIDAASEKRLFTDLKAVEGFNDYLRATMVRDKDRYFNAENDKARDVVKGAFARTLYLKSKLMNPLAEDKEEPIGNRYAK